MKLDIYAENRLVDCFEYGKGAVFHGETGEQVKAVIERASAADAMVAGESAAAPGVPLDWLRWAAGIVYPTAAMGAFVVCRD